MRFAMSAASVLFAGLLTSAAFADPVAPAPAVPAVTAPAAKKVPLRVVRVLDSTHQALLYNKLKNTHVLVEQGKEIDGYTVDDIDDDSVTLTPLEGGAQVVLAGPDPSWRGHGSAAPAARSPEKPATATRAPEDPYAAAAPMDPYGEASEASEASETSEVRAPGAPATQVRSVEAPGTIATRLSATPITAGEGGVRTTEAPGSSPEPSRPPVIAPMTASPTPPVTPPVSVAPPVTPGPPVTLGPPVTVIARTEITAALANFGALASSIRGSFTPAGARLDTFPPGSLLARAGFRDGDLITSVNNHPLRSLDDAADLYARAGSMKAATIQVQRAGNPVTLRLTFP